MTNQKLADLYSERDHLLGEKWLKEIETGYEHYQQCETNTATPDLVAYAHLAHSLAGSVPHLLAAVRAANAELAAVVHDLRAEQPAYQRGREDERVLILNLLSNILARCAGSYEGIGLHRAIAELKPHVPARDPLPPDQLAAENERLRTAVRAVLTLVTPDGVFDHRSFWVAVEAARVALGEATFHAAAAAPPGDPD